MADTTNRFVAMAVLSGGGLVALAAGDAAVSARARPANSHTVCSCMITSDWVARREAVSDLFIGVVIAESLAVFPIRSPSDSLMRWWGATHKARLIVEHAWKLSARRLDDSVLATVWTGRSGGECGVYFRVGERYLVVAVNGATLARAIDSVEAKPGRLRLSDTAASSLTTYRCMGTASLAERKEALEQLGPATAIVDSIPRRPPNR